ncbi:MAG: hypothetical protein WCK31_00790 [bacterium]
MKWVSKQILSVTPTVKTIKPGGLVMIADVTFFGRGFGYIVFRSPSLKKNLYYKFIPYETILEYSLGRYDLESKGFKISAIVLDGRPGVRKVFYDIPVQMCHFHQKQIVRRYLTNNPKLEAGIELKKINSWLCKENKKDFTDKLNRWYERWKIFLKEKTYELNSKNWHYTHGRLRSAYRSLRTNLPYLFTYLDYPELNIPNTTNSLDGSFANLKELVRIHRGFNDELKHKLIESILTN